MTYLLWSLLNIGLFAFFIVICFRATKLVREKINLLAAIIFVFGLLSFMSRPIKNNNNKKPGTSEIMTWQFNSEDSLHRNGIHMLTIVLEKNLISTYNLGIKYGKDKQGQINIPLSAYSTNTGYISGTLWKPLSVVVNQTNDNQKFEYRVEGIVEWSLLGARIFSQSKEFKGVVSIR